MTTGERIKQRREALGLTQVDLANLVGTYRQQIYKYERGIIKDIPRETVKKIAQVLHTTPAYLFDWETDEEILERLGARQTPLEELSDPIQALNVLLYRIGERVIKTRGKYYLGEAGELSEDDLQYLLDTATGSLRPAVEMLKKRAERELRARLSGEKDLS